jgi:hypothetical protein
LDVRADASLFRAGETEGPSGFARVLVGVGYVR